MKGGSRDIYELVMEGILTEGIESCNRVIEGRDNRRCVFDLVVI